MLKFHKLAFQQEPLLFACGFELRTKVILKFMSFFKPFEITVDQSKIFRAILRISCLKNPHFILLLEFLSDFARVLRLRNKHNTFKSIAPFKRMT